VFLDYLDVLMSKINFRKIKATAIIIANIIIMLSQARSYLKSTLKSKNHRDGRRALNWQGGNISGTEMRLENVIWMGQTNRRKGEYFGIQIICCIQWMMKKRREEDSLSNNCSLYWVPCQPSSVQSLHASLFFLQ
jgi:hypothetical protein